jgi:hypothetical protein
MAACKVPKDIAERYLPWEAPTFEVIRPAGDVRLWKSVTKPQHFADWTRRAPCGLSFVLCRAWLHGTKNVYWWLHGGYMTLESKKGLLLNS